MSILDSASEDGMTVEDEVDMTTEKQSLSDMIAAITPRDPTHSKQTPGYPQFRRDGRSWNLKLKLLQDRVAVVRADPEEMTPGGLVVPERARLVSTRAYVLAVGPGLPHKHDEKLADQLRNDLNSGALVGNVLRSHAADAADALSGPVPPAVRPGTFVHLARWEGTEVKVDGETILLVREDGILAEEVEG